MSDTQRRTERPAPAIDVLREALDLLYHGVPPDHPVGRSQVHDDGVKAARWLEELQQAAEETVAGVERDLPEWLADDGEYTVDGFDYFIRLAAAVARTKGKP